MFRQFGKIDSEKGKGGVKSRLIHAVVLLGISAVLMTTAQAAEAGSSGDPLITLSYLNDVFLGTVMEQVDAKIALRNEDIAASIGASSGGTSTGVSDTFTVVTLSQGQKLEGDIGCEVMLRVGSAVCVSASAPGLIDETSGETLNNGGALIKNHLYMMTIEGRSVKADAATVKLLARGSYSVG